MSPRIADEQKVWETPDSQSFYGRHRRTPEELYESERYFLPEAVRAASSCLDVGCATGGFCRVMRSFNPSLKYTGVDVSARFVERARRDFPDATFFQGDGVSFPTPPGSHDLVHLSGVLHLNSFHREILAACYAQARRFLLCDFRLTRGPAVTGRMRPEFEPGRAAGGELPYLVLNVDEHVRALRTLTPPPRRIRAKGYWRAPSPDVALPLKKVLMAFFLIEKGAPGGVPDVVLDLPPEAAS